ncbi:MAG: TssQ family T6SS-associated lipoprotein [Pseudomonadota bacterium]
MTPLAKEELIAAPEVEIKKEDVSPAVSTEPVVNLPVRSVLTAERIALNDGIRLYNEGNFNAAIKRLGGAAEIWAADKPAQLEALKYMAFSYCVSSRQALCRQQFEKALRLDPSFDLAPGEKGHPLWGPAFARSKKNR